MVALMDPYCGCYMAQTSNNLARDFGISREGVAQLEALLQLADFLAGALRDGGRGLPARRNRGRDRNAGTEERAARAHLLIDDLVGRLGKSALSQQALQRLPRVAASLQR